MNPVWIDRGITALVVLVFVFGGSTIETLIRRKRISTRPSEIEIDALSKGVQELVTDYQVTIEMKVRRRNAPPEGR